MKKSFALLAALVLIACSTIKGTISVHEDFSLTTKNGEVKTISTGEYPVKLKITGNKAKVEISGENTKDKYYFEGNLNEVKEGDFDISVINEGAKFRFVGSYAYEETFLGRSQEMKTCIKPVNNLPGQSFVYWDLYEVTETLSATLMNENKTADFARIESDETKEIKRNLYESPCM